MPGSITISFSSSLSALLRSARTANGRLCLRLHSVTLSEAGAFAKSLQIDGIIPIIDSVSTYAIDGIYSTGDTMDISISFNEVVNVTGIPQLRLETGTTDVMINYRSGSGQTRCSSWRI